METEENNLALLCSTYDDYKTLERELAQRLGYSNRLEIPANLVSEIARFCNSHPDDMMTAFYACSLINKFYRKRTAERWVRLFHSLDSHLHRKKFLLEIFFGYYTTKNEQSILMERCSAASIWRAIDDLEDGYGKANQFTKFSSVFTEDIARLAYQKALAMPVKYRIRALAGIYPRVDMTSKENIFSFLRGEFVDGSWEAAYQLTRLFSEIDAKFQAELISIYLNEHNLSEQYVAQFVIRNGASLSNKDAQEFIFRIREFQSVYLLNRCLLKLSCYLPSGEIDALYQHYIESFPSQPPSSELIHNLYHFGAVLKYLDKDNVIRLALEKIGSFDDSKNKIYDQHKYYELSFIVPHLNEKHKKTAFAVAETIRGGYKRNIISKLKHHFSNIG